MKLIHYSSTIVKQVFSFEQANSVEPDAINGKPIGLWLSCDGYEPNWFTYAKGRDHLTKRLQYKHEVKLTRNNKILKITTPYQLDKFSDDYWTSVELMPTFRLINWGKVATKYQGIIIAPFQYTKRHTVETFWYWGWDCASGCIWDADAIASIRVLNKEQATHARTIG